MNSLSFRVRIARVCASRAYEQLSTPAYPHNKVVSPFHVLDSRLFPPKTEKQSIRTQYHPRHKHQRSNQQPLAILLRSPPPIPVPVPPTTPTPATPASLVAVPVPPPLITVATVLIDTPVRVDGVFLRPAVQGIPASGTGSDAGELPCPGPGRRTVVAGHEGFVTAVAVGGGGGGGGGGGAG
jgi:hypothetical protein